MNGQGDLFDTVPELRFYTNILDNCKRIAKERYPIPIGEDREEYAILLRDETRLEFCEHLRKIADEIEEKTLKRQKETIAILASIRKAIF